MYVTPAGATALHAGLAAGRFLGVVVTGSYARLPWPAAARSQLAV